jgi:selenocysteine lyase/cysteine desulfurase
VDAAALRSQFPVLERVAYLNTGTDGPLPAAAVRAGRAELDAELAEGRATAHFERRFALQGELRVGYARVLGCEPADVALTTSTSEGLGAVLAGLALGPRDEVVTSDQEHPGLIGPLKVARDRGAEVRAVPLRDVADAVRPSTTVVACSHVGWISGEVAPAALAEVDVPVVLDGAQGAGAVPLDVRALGCDAYAAAGQKWLCGADGTGMLYVAQEFRTRLPVVTPSYVCFEDVTRGLDSPYRADARRYDTPSLSRESAAMSLAALGVLEDAGLAEVHARAAALAGRLAAELSERGRTVAPRGETTLVAWEDADPETTRDRLAAAGVVVRNLPGTPLLRASVGAWNDEGDLERLLRALGG